MRKSTIVTIFLIYLASIVAIGFLGTRVRVYNEVRYVKDISLSVHEANKSYCKFSDEVLYDESTGYKIIRMSVSYKNYKQNNKLEFAFIPTFTFKDGTKEEMTGGSLSYQINSQTYVDKGWISISNDGVITISNLTKVITPDITIKPVTSALLDFMPDAGIILQLTIR